MFQKWCVVWSLGVSVIGDGEVSGRWFNDEEDHLHGDLVATLAVTGRADLTDAQWAVLEPLLPTRQEAGTSAEVDETAAHRRDPVAGAGRRAVAGRAGMLRAVADGLWAVPPLAARRHLAADPDRVAGPRRRGRADHLGRQRGLHDRPGAPARGRGA